MAALKLITAPTVEPLTLEEVKAHLRVQTTDDDGLIELYMKAARMAIEGPDGWVGRAFVTQVWELVIDAFPEDGDILIPMPPLQTVDSIKYDDPDGDEQVMSVADYFVDNVNEPGWVVLSESASWPTTLDSVNSVRIRFTAGYAPDVASSPADLRANIPFNIKAGILLTVGSLYEHREEVVVGSVAVKLPWGAENLLRPSRVQLGMA